LGIGASIASFAWNRTTWPQPNVRRGGPRTALLISTGRLDSAIVKERLYEVAMREAMIVRSHNTLQEAVDLASQKGETE
jgi:hypothetical protein